MNKRQISVGIVFIASLAIIGNYYHPCYSGEPQNTNKNEMILSEVEQKKGFRPNPLLLMSKRNDVLANFMSYGKQIFEGGPLTEKEVYLIVLSAAVALKSPNCIRAHTKTAQKLGASKDEIVQAILIAGIISNTSPLHVAYDLAGIFKDK
jgi:AhpD family alkylhydroperoxidase